MMRSCRFKQRGSSMSRRVAFRVSSAAGLALAVAGVATGQPFRSADASGNNLAHPTWGQAGTDLIRLAPAAYPDGHSAMARPNGPNPRDVSNAVVLQSAPVSNGRNLSDLIWQWGQFLDH